MMTIRPMTRLCSLVFDRLELVDGQAKDWLMGLRVMNACKQWVFQPHHSPLPTATNSLTNSLTLNLAVHAVAVNTHALVAFI